MSPSRNHGRFNYWFGRPVESAKIGGRDAFMALMSGRRVDGLKLAGKLRSGVDIRGFWILRSCNLDGEDVAGAKHVAGKDDELLIGREAHIGLQTVIVVRHIDQMLGMKDSRLPVVSGIDSSRPNVEHLRMKQLDPLPVRSLGHLAGVAAVSGEESLALGQVEVNRPFVALHVVSDSLAGLQVVAGEEKILALRVLPVIPDSAAIQAQNSWPAISMAMVRLWMSVFRVPSV